MENNEKKIQNTDGYVEDKPKSENIQKRRGNRHKKRGSRRGGSQKERESAEQSSVTEEEADFTEIEESDETENREKSGCQDKNDIQSASDEDYTEPESEDTLETESENTAAQEESSETEVVGVHFKKSGKLYYFDPSGLKIDRDAHVIVETARGLEFGYVSAENRMVHNREIVQPLKKVVRIATEEDEKHREENEQKEIEAFNTCLVKIEERKLEMKLVEVEYTFDNSKLLFYFTADGRVDFRDLVKDLATIFRTRIELRQIGIRDEAKMMGGLGICGRPFCCKSFLPDFVQVSIKMAKEQNLSLNSAKISGACGRLMCCLRYEYDTYIAESALTPKVDSIVSTPDGDGVVVETSPLAGLVKVSLKKAPDQPPQLYHRDNIKVKGNVKKDSEREETKIEDDNSSTEPDGDKL